MKNRLIFLVLFSLGAFVLFSAPLTTAQTGYVGVETCRGCHAEYYDSYVKNVHGKKAVTGSPATRNDCESCHGPGAAHVDRGGGRGTGIFTFDEKADPKEKAAKCRACHDDSRHLAFWDLSKHKTAGISCDNCHSSHTGGHKNLKAPQPELCYSCHRDIRSQANKQSHHPIREGKISCNDCHDPHGSFGQKMIKADVVNELCYKCHAEKRGPFMWEHPPVEEDCMVCHTPHGSNHSKLMVRKTPQLCQSCHDWSRHPGTPYTQFESFTGPSISNKMVGRNCLNCHTNVHGTNGPSKRGLRFVR
jgi:DmsE family decaheme c-type cytochrome